MSKVNDPAERLRLNREQAIKYARAASGKRVVELMKAARADLDKRIKTAEGLSGPGKGTFTATHARVAREQLTRVIVPLQRGLTKLIVEQSQITASSAVKGSLKYLADMDRKFTGIGAAAAPRLHEAMILDTVVSGMESSVLRRLATSGKPQSSMKEPHKGKQGILDRYGMNVIGAFEKQLQLRFVGQKSWAEVRKAIIDESPFLTAKGGSNANSWAERIVRTEVMAANNRANWETIGEADKVLGDAVKILAATFDDRTHADSYAVHGQIRRIDEPFESWFGAYMAPPNRPNDREIVVPHRLSWPLPPELAWISDGEIAAAWEREGRKGGIPPRPKMTTIPVDKFGKVQPLPEKKAPEKPAGPAKVPEAKPAPKKPVKVPPRPKKGGPKEPPTVMVDGVKLPALGGTDRFSGKAMQWAENPDPKRPWRDAQRAMATLSGHDPYIAVTAIGIKELDGPSSVAIQKRIDKRVSIDYNYRSEYLRYEKEYTKDAAPVGLSKKTLPIDAIETTVSTVKRGRISDEISLETYRDMMAEKFTSTTPVVYKLGNRYIVNDPESMNTIAADRMLGRFKTSVVVIDVEALHTAPLGARNFVADVPTSMNPKGRSKIREMMRGLFANDGVLSRDKSLIRGNAGTIEFKKLAPNIGGTHTFSGGKIRLRREYRARIETAMKELRAAWKSGDFTKAWDALGNPVLALIHEEAHGASPIKSSGYQGTGVGFEEATNELYARRKIRELYKITQRPPLKVTETPPGYWRSPDNVEAPHHPRERYGWRPRMELGKWRDPSDGAYTSYTEALYTATHKVIGIKPEHMPEVVDRAIIGMRKNNGHESISIDDARKSYIDAIDGMKVGGETIRLTSDQRAELFRGLKYNKDLEG
jgi:hypothetical protein